MLPSRAVALVALVALPLLPACRSAGDGPAPAAREGWGEVLAGTLPRAGFVTVHVDAPGGRALLELPPARDGVHLEALYVTALRTGLGSNPVGLDRGQLGATRWVSFRRVGARVLLVEHNPRFRATTATADEARAVEESFAESVLWSGEVLAEREDGRVLVDAAPLAVRDAHGVAAALERSGQGDHALDPERSALSAEGVLVFPDNVVLEALLTFSGAGRGREVASILPSPKTVSLEVRHTFVRLPGPGYEPRAADPRTGHLSLGYRDYAAPLSAPVESRLALRHRLGDGPLVYHVDGGAPEPVRSALVEGARWWADAFAAAGRPETFRVEVLPEGVHPLDVRYNVIEWVHRRTRGWSYGGGVVDPRTGEILKGHVLLGSLRVRQDLAILEGLLGVGGGDSGADPLALALARLRQLAAHEVGHALGLAHNFAASTYGRASVMDYPPPRVRPAADGGLDASEAYAVGVGEWDRTAVRWLYGSVEPGEEGRLRLDAWAAEAPLFLSDEDARPAGAAHPRAALWDDGDDPVAALADALEVRRRALADFGPDRLPAGRPAGELAERLVPVYLFHRYQVEAAAKVVGGALYRHAVVGGEDPGPGLERVDAGWQRSALAGLSAALSPAALRLPDGVRAALAPPAPDREAGERFGSDAAPLFDEPGAAAVAADLVAGALLQRERAARVVDQAALDPSLPDLEDVLAAVWEPAFAGPSDPVAEAVRAAVVARTLRLASDPEAAPRVRARVEAHLERALERGALAAPTGPADGHLAAEIRRHLERNHAPLPPVPLPAGAPPGPPIGAAGGAEAAARALAGGWGDCAAGHPFPPLLHQPRLR